MWCVCGLQGTLYIGQYQHYYVLPPLYSTGYMATKMLCRLSSAGPRHQVICIFRVTMCIRIVLYWEHLHSPLGPVQSVYCRHAHVQASPLFGALRAMAPFLAQNSLMSRGVGGGNHQFPGDEVHAVKRTVCCMPTPYATACLLKKRCSTEANDTSTRVCGAARGLREAASSPMKIRNLSSPSRMQQAILDMVRAQGEGALFCKSPYQLMHLHHCGCRVSLDILGYPLFATFCPNLQV